MIIAKALIQCLRVALACVLCAVISSSTHAQLSDYTRHVEVVMDQDVNTGSDAIFIAVDNSSAYVNIHVTNPASHGSFAPSFSRGANHIEVFGIYTSEAGFTGRDTVRAEVRIGHPLPVADLYYVTFIFEVKPSVVRVQDEFLSIESPYSPVVIDVISNDISTSGGVHLHSILASDAGSVFRIGNNLWLQPDHGELGAKYIHYLVCDANDECKPGRVFLSLVDNTAIMDTLQVVVGKGAEVKQMLPKAGYQLLQQANAGMVHLGALGDYFIYNAPNDQASDAFVISHGGSQSFVEIDVVDVTASNVANDDYAMTSPGDEVTIQVKRNDPGRNFYIQSYTQPIFGELTQQADGVFSYQADSIFVGIDRFEYTLCALQHCETAEVFITCHPFSPAPLPQHNAVGTKNRSVLLNYDVPVRDYTFEVSTPASHGIVSVFPGTQDYSEGCLMTTGHFMIRYMPDTDFSGQDQFTVEYCSDGICELVTVAVDILDQTIYDPCRCLDQCVWPGDVDHNGRVDRSDLLHLAYAMGHTGQVRNWADEDSWYGQHAPDWITPLNLAPSANLKHADCNGDGVISMADAEAIQDHMGYHQGIRAEAVPIVMPYSMSLVFDGGAIPSIGDTVTMFISLGEVDAPVSNILGIDLDITFDPNAVDSAYTRVTSVKENWLRQGSYAIDPITKSGATFSLATARIDQQAQSGYGYVFAVETIIDDVLDGIRYQGDTYIAHVDLKDITLMDASGQTFALPNQRIPFEIKIPTNSPTDKAERLRAYPNPVHDVLYVETLSAQQSVEIVNMTGQVAHRQQLANDQLISSFSLPHLPAGTYVVRTVLVNGEVEVATFVKL